MQQVVPNTMSFKDMEDEHSKGPSRLERKTVPPRTKTAALLGIACLGLTACAPSSRQPPSPQPERIVAIDPHDISSEYRYLPAGVKRDVLAVNQESVLQQKGVFSGSGVLVHYDGKIRALTAAHLLAGVHCVNSLIHTNTSPSTDYFVKKQGEALPRLGLDAAVQDLVNDSNLENIALPTSVIPGKQSVNLRGSIAFSISFEPTATGIVRTPGSPNPYSAPAEFSEVVLGEVNGDYFAVDGVGASYGHEWDITGRPGQSGSPVVTADGQHLIGLSVAGTTRSATDILTDFGVQLPDTGQQYHLSIIQPITGDIMHKLDSAADAAPLCN